MYYASIILVFNIGGEELWWRGYVFPRQELSFPNSVWIIHGMMWSAFHLFMQPTLWDTTRMAISGIALAYVVYRTRNTWTGIIGHTAGNLPFFISLVHGVSAS
jgi:membrane protease YdiL (CAAX protease family)